MANQLTKDLEIYFEAYVNGFDDSCIGSMEAPKFTPDPEGMQRAGDVFYRPQDYHMNVVEGLDVSGAAQTDLIQRMVPSVMKQPQNVIWQLDAKERRDPEILKNSGLNAGRRLASKVDSDFMNNLAMKAATVVTQTGTNSWDLYGELDAKLDSIGAPMGLERKIFLNSKDYNAIASELGSRQYLNGIPKTAYERAQIPDIASFRAFKNGSSPVIAGSAVTGLTLTAQASYTPTAMDGDLPKDNRGMSIGVSAATLQNGDVFVIEGVDSVHMISKQPAGYQQTFRVVSGGGTVNPTIYPAIVASGAYQNVTAVAANGAAITLLNTTTNGANVGWVDGAAELICGRLAFPSDEGVKIMRETTKNGIEVIMGYQFDLMTGTTQLRNLAFYGCSVLEPSQCVLALPNQA